jgi:hypothetical protein
MPGLQASLMQMVVLELHHRSPSITIYVTNKYEINLIDYHTLVILDHMIIIIHSDGQLIIVRVF